MGSWDSLGGRGLKFGGAATPVCAVDRVAGAASANDRYLSVTAKPPSGCGRTLASTRAPIRLRPTIKFRQQLSSRDEVDQVSRGPTREAVDIERADSSDSSRRLICQVRA
jgi:hypothetical protein